MNIQVTGVRVAVFVIVFFTVASLSTEVSIRKKT